MDRPSPALMWDVLEEHLDEAEFLWEVREQSLVAPNYTLAEVAAGPEARLLAHVDGLVVGGPAVARRLLVPALEEDEPARVAAAALALLEGGADGGLAAIVELLREAPEPRPALTRALVCAQRPGLGPRLRALLADDDDAVVAAAAAVMHAQHEPLGDALAVLLRSEDPVARALALRAVADEASPARHLRALQAALAEDDDAIAGAAMAAGVRLGLPAAWARARERAAQPDGGPAALLLALAAAPAELARLLALLDQPRARAGAVWALGFVGTPEVVDACLEWLDDATLGPLVGEVFSAVTGVDLEAARLSAPAPAREALAHAPEDALPRPEPMAVMQWWLQHRGRFAAGRRHVAGVPRSLAAIVGALERGPMRRRPGLLLDLQLRSPPAARPRLQPHAPTRRQYAELAALVGLRLSPLELDRPLA